MSYQEIGHEHLEKLDDAHILLFHEEQKKAEEIEFKFIKTGLEKKQTCFYTTNNPERLKDKMTEFGIDVKNNVENKLLNIVQIPKEFEDYEKMIMDKVEGLPQDVKIRVVSTHYFDFNSEQKTDRMAEIEQCVDDDFHKLQGNFVCSFAVHKITNEIRGRFLNQLLDSHTAIIFQTEKSGTEVFTLP